MALKFTEGCADILLAFHVVFLVHQLLHSSLSATHSLHANLRNNRLYNRARSSLAGSHQLHVNSNITDN